MQNQSHSYNSKLFETVINGGYCIGCGACASIKDSPIIMAIDSFHKFIATAKNPITESMDNTLNRVCPFSDNGLNEDQIGEELYQNHSSHHPQLGFSIETYAGFVNEDSFRKNGSSGGMVTWILTELFRNNIIDGAIHIQPRTPTTNDFRIFQYQLSTNLEQIALGAKSRYYPIELSEVMTIIRNRPGKYAVVGIPCFIKAVRLLNKEDKILNDRIKYCVGLVCGHLKSARFADLFAWQNGIHPSKLISIDFRSKIDGLNANQYGVTLKGSTNEKIESITTKPANKLYGTNWGYGFFKYKACDYCDDVVGETADITLGDAWLPRYNKDSNGTNVIIVRDPIIYELIENARKENKISLEKITKDEVVKSQSSGFSHRRQGLAYRLFLADQRGIWRPKKRIKAETIINKKIQQRQVLRIILTEQSHLAFKNAIDENDFSSFKIQLDPILAEYNKLYRPPLWRRIASKIYHSIIR